MPTGYTACVEDGSVADLRTFALTCARAFGACVTLRDEPMGQAPKVIEPDTKYYDEGLARANALRAEVHALSDAKCEARAAAEYQTACERWAELRSRMEAENQRYDAMLAQVEAWTPPSAEHVEFKAFMANQLAISKSNYRPERPTQKTGAEWRAETLAECARDIAYHTEQRQKEIDRAAGRTKWLSDLHASLEPQS